MSNSTDSGLTVLSLVNSIPASLIDLFHRWQLLLKFFTNNNSVTMANRMANRRTYSHLLTVLFHSGSAISLSPSYFNITRY